MARDEENPHKCRVHFEPDGFDITVEPGTSLLEAAHASGVLLDAVCGGYGRCGRCKVRVKGKASVLRGSQRATIPTDSERNLLACTTTVEGDLEVFIPESSRIGIHQILEASERVPLKAISPLVRKSHLLISPPSLQDNLSDVERLRRALENEDQRRAGMSLPVLRTIPAAMRKKEWDVTVSFAETVSGHEIVAVEPGDTSLRLLGICVDVGTTTVVLSLIDLSSGETIHTESTYNKQIVCGEDVLSRITYAEEHGTRNLTRLVTETINYLITEACDKASEKLNKRVSPVEIISASVSGNPAMIHFLLGLDTRNMRLEPYVPVSNAPQCPRAYELNLVINPNSMVFISPGRSGYVGGDVLSDVLASGMHLRKNLSLLIDVGTNGEVVLGRKDWMICCSCSAGPAFEGGEVSSGMRAMRGAIDRLQIERSGEIRFHTIGEADPLGICGSGLVDLISDLFVHGIIDRSGNFDRSRSDRIREGSDGELEFVIAKRGKRELAKGWVDEAPSEITVRETDIQNILRTKAAIYSGCSVLLKSMDHEFSDLHEIIIAGGFGQYLDIRKAILVGLFPDIDIKKYRFIGNGSLEGARLMLLSRQKRRELYKIYKNMTYFELSVSGLFFDEFTSALFLPHTNVDLFPSSRTIVNNVNHQEAN